MIENAWDIEGQIIPHGHAEMGFAEWCTSR